MGVVNTTYKFTETDTITSSKLNNIIDDTTFTSDAISGSSLQIVSPGKLAVAAVGVTSNELASSSVTTAKIANLNVTTAKLANSSVTVDKLASSSVTTEKLANSSSTTTGVTTAKIADANITAAKLNGQQTGSAPIYGIRAWIGFNGTGSNPIFIDRDGNIASVSKVATGQYTITFTTPMPNDGYVLIGSTSDSNGEVASVNFFDKTVSSFECKTYAETQGLFDFTRVYIMVII